MGAVGTSGAIVITAYLIGSIPTAYIVGRAVGGLDIRISGEGNVGARNVYHVVGRAWGVAVAMIDLAKGAVVAFALHDHPAWQLALGGVAVLAGHDFSVWLGFVGGKGVATASGFGIALFLPAAVFGGAGAGVVFALTRRFLPTLIVAIVGSFVAAMLLGEAAVTLALVVSLFALTGVKRALDEPRMREIEASTGWDRAVGGTR